MAYIKDDSPFPRMDDMCQAYTTHVVNLDIESFCYRNDISEEMMGSVINNGNFSSYFDDITKQMVIRMETKMAFKPITSIVISGYEIPEIHSSAVNVKVFNSIWQLFKQKFFPWILKKWFPPKYKHVKREYIYQEAKKVEDTVVKIKDYYPSVDIPKHRAHTCIDILDVDLGKSHVKVIEDPVKLKAKDNYRIIKNIINEAIKLEEGGNDPYMLAGRHMYMFRQLKELI